MSRTRKVVLVLVSCLVVAGAWLASARVAGLPPFSGPADIRAQDVCGSLGDREAAAATLPRALPEEAEYSFGGDDPVRADERDTNYAAHCWIRSDGKVLLSAGAELIGQGRSPAQWLEETIRANHSHGEDDQVTFTAGDKAVATSRMAAIRVPCLPSGRIPGGPRSLSVVVDAVRQPHSSATESRQALADLALAMASHTYERAHCTEPSGLPDTAPTLPSAP